MVHLSGHTLCRFRVLVPIFTKLIQLDEIYERSVQNEPSIGTDEKQEKHPQIQTEHGAPGTAGPDHRGRSLRRHWERPTSAIIIQVTEKKLRDEISQMNCKIGGREDGFDPVYTTYPTPVLRSH